MILFWANGQGCNCNLKGFFYFEESYPEFNFLSLSIKDLTKSMHTFDSPSTFR